MGQDRMYLFAAMRGWQDSDAASC